MSITEKTRREDDKLRDRLRKVDPADLNRAIKLLINSDPTAGKKTGKRQQRKAK